MSDDRDIADDKSAAAVLGQADAEPRRKAWCCLCRRQATRMTQGVPYCDRCDNEPSWMKRTFLSLLAALCLSGCLRRSEPDTTEMQRYYDSLRALDAQAMSETLDLIDSLDEAGYRAELGQRLQASAVGARQELSEADAALSADGYTSAKARSLLQRRIRETTDAR